MFVEDIFRHFFICFFSYLASKISAISKYIFYIVWNAKMTISRCRTNHSSCILFFSSLLFYDILFFIQIVNASFAKLCTRNIGFMDTFTIPTVRKRNITPVIDTKGKDIIFFPIHLPGHWALWVRYVFLSYWQTV